ncbi:ACP S-malonyltransferase [Streptomyces broussonetiae]|uniref:[acyl-carrier-protein] S-malonyltransferase n=1 Tax=Streptomyces broussonetiae TaxID=2686304 RepID=A0ABV5E6G2_9ACTN
MCPGQGAYLPGALGPLRDHPPVSAVLEKVDAHAGVSVSVATLLTEPGSTPPEELVVSHPLVFDLATYTAAVAAASVVRDLLPVPADAVIGHSVGDLAALTVAGALTIRQGVQLLTIRDRLLRDARLPRAGLLVTDMTWNQATALLHEAHTPRVRVAAHNAPTQTVLAGPEPDLAPLQQAARARGHRAAPLTSRTAFHHPLLAEVHRTFRRLLQSQPLRRPVLPIHTTAADGRRADTPAQLRTAAASHLADPLHFTRALHTLHQAGFTTYIDTGPRALLTTLTKTNLPTPHTCAPLRTPANLNRIHDRLTTALVTVDSPT